MQFSSLKFNKNAFAAASLPRTQRESLQHSACFVGGLVEWSGAKMNTARWKIWNLDMGLRAVYSMVVIFNLQGATKNSFLKFFAVFSATVSNFNMKYKLYLLKPVTFNCQVRYDSDEKRRSYRLFNITAYRFFSIKNVQAKNAI